VGALSQRFRTALPNIVIFRRRASIRECPAAGVRRRPLTYVPDELAVLDLLSVLDTQCPVLLACVQDEVVTFVECLPTPMAVDARHGLISGDSEDEHHPLRDAVAQRDHLGRSREYIVSHKSFLLEIAAEAWRPRRLGSDDKADRSKCSGSSSPRATLLAFVAHGVSSIGDPLDDQRFEADLDGGEWTPALAAQGRRVGTGAALAPAMGNRAGRERSRISPPGERVAQVIPHGEGERVGVGVVLAVKKGSRSSARAREPMTRRSSPWWISPRS